MKYAITLAAALCAGGTFAETLNLPLLEGEHWWGGQDADGRQMPFTAASDYKADLRVYHAGNQAAPLLLSDKGRFVWCEEPFAFAFGNGALTVEADAKIESGKPADSLRGAYLHCSKAFFPPSGKTPDLLFVSAPQYNTWIELTYNQNENDILKYAQSMLDNGLPPGVLMIDDTWQTGYGLWRFEPTRFKDPKGLCAKLHEMGFKVMFWVCPFVSMDTPEFRTVEKEGGFLLLKTPAAGGPKDDPAPIRWWNGKSAVLDLTHPNGFRWFEGELSRLRREFGVDGFKLDAGDPEYYVGDYRSYRPCTASGQCEAYAKIGLKFPFNEYRACWKMAGQPLVQRLRDKDHEWSEVPRLITDMIAAGLLGHSFVCPDMIGGGQFTSFLPGSNFDPELFVRSAQVHALCPMMQFSASPWRVLDAEKQEIVRKAVALRQTFAPKFVALAKACATSGEPMLRSLEYAYPGCGYAEVKDEFLMGDFLLVAPQLEKGKLTRTVVVPPGMWRADDGSEVIGPKSVVVKTPLDRIPHFTRR